jgi:hypothetical protein
MNQKLGFAILLSAILMGETALSCPPSLRGLRSQFLPAEGGDLCAFADRYERAKAAAREAGIIDTTRIADVRAPRFIANKDWLSHTTGLFSNYDPRFIYSTSDGARGSVWSGWDKAANRIDGLANHLARMSERGYTDRYNFSVDWIRNTHLNSLGASEPKIAGRFRTDFVLGTEINRETAPAVAEIKVALASSYPSAILKGATILTWEDTVCFDDIPLFKKFSVRSGDRGLKIDNLPKGGGAYTDSNGIVRHCGTYQYSSPSEIAVQLGRLGDDLTTRMNLLLSGRGAGNPSADPILIGAHAQRWFVSIHPFDGGNGRTSRFIMDFLVQSVGLPTPVLADMTRDLVTPEPAWALEVGRGMVRTVETIEACAKNPSADRCTEVPY